MSESRPERAVTELLEQAQVPTGPDDERVWDVLVVGGGPSGSAAALRALQLRPGARVAVLDAAAFPRDKPCGDGIAPHGVDVARDLGVRGLVAGYVPVDRMRLRTPGGAEVATPVLRANYVIPRQVFDARLLAAAVGVGARLLRGRVREVVREADRVVCVTSAGRFAARVVVGADGANSRVRRELGIGPNPAGSLAIAVRGYAAAPSGDEPPEQLVHMVDDGWPAYAWSFPIGDGRANIGYGKLRDRLGAGKEELHGTLSTLLPDQPAEPSSLRAHHLPLSTWRPRQPDGRVLLAGDAASLINPLTGEGIYYALLSGALAGEAAVLRGGEAGAAYRSALAHELGRHLRHTGVLARLVVHRPLMDAAIGAARRRPEFYDGLVELGLGRGLVPAPAVAKVVWSYARRRVGA